jgi:hypothetical protein
MRSWTKLIVPALLTLGCSFAHAEGPGRDYPSFLAIDGYERSYFVEHRFDEAVFLSDDKGTKTTVAGHFFEIGYELKDPTAGGDPYLLNSLLEQFKTIHAEVLNRRDNCPRLGHSFPPNRYDNYLETPVLTVRFERNNIPVWVAITCQTLGSDWYFATVVEEQPFHH